MGDGRGRWARLGCRIRRNLCSVGQNTLHAVCQDHQGQRRELYGKRADLALSLAEQAGISAGRDRARTGGAMRNTFSEALYKAASSNPDIYIVVADISPAGSMAKFSEQYPARFINVGVAEQSMIGICAGLALKGCQPFAYTIATFSLYRPFEMVRDDLCYQNLPVTVVGMGAGVIYSTLGGTHHTQEYIAIAAALPNLQIVAPCDPLECTEATRWCAQQKNGPVYLRIGKAGEPVLTKGAQPWQFGKVRYLRRGS